MIDGEGDLLELGGEALDSPGYDLLAVLTGSEGNLGVITRATLRLLPRPEATETLLAALRHGRRPARRRWAPSSGRA